MSRAVLLGLTATTMACEVGTDDESRPETPAVSSQSTVVGCCGATSSTPDIDGLRLTLTEAVQQLDSPLSASVYAAPYTSDMIALFDGNAWITRKASPVPYINPTQTPNAVYDVFAYWSGTEVRLEVIPWPSGGRNTLGVQDGVQVKNGDATRRYIGVVANGSNGWLRDTATDRFVWNRYNQVPRQVATDMFSAWNWQYTNPGNAWRAAGNGNVPAVNVVVGAGHPQNATGNVIGGSYASVHAQSMAYTTSSSGWIAAGIGIDSSTANSAQVANLAFASPTVWAYSTAFYEGYLPAGMHSIKWLEVASGTPTYVFLGKDPVSPGKTGMVGWIMM